jgi:UDP-N-acetylmuramoyl-tripeptide--D-alanyl-D-alanine ligase
MEIEALYDIYRKHPTVITDSRVPVEGSLFFGLRGEHFNGSLYARDALSGGSSFAVVDDPAVVRDESYILVENSLETLQELATYHRKRLSIPIIAITGSNGKTTTKDLTSKILSTQYITKATSGNLNNHIGVPLTLLGITDSVEFGIIEMGANHTGEIARLCRIALPDFGLITNIGMAHLEGFGSLEGVKKAKKELYDYLEENGGLVFTNEQDTTLRDMLLEFDGGIIWYGGTGESVLSGEVMEADPLLRIRLDIRGYGILEMETGLVGSYNLENIIAAASIGLHFGINPVQIKKAIQHYRMDNNRSQQLITDHNVLILDAYNANPTSMRAAIENFRSMLHPDKSVILGDMLELGEVSGAAHKEVIDFLENAGFREIILVGTSFANAEVPESYHVFSTVAECAVWLVEYPLRNRMILLKGSRGIGLEQLAGML